MPTRAEILRDAAAIIDVVVEEHSAVLITLRQLDPDHYLDHYKEHYSRIEAGAIAHLADIYSADCGQNISLVLDLDPILQAKMKEFAWNFYPKDPDKIN